MIPTYATRCPVCGLLVRCTDEALPSHANVAALPGPLGRPRTARGEEDFAATEGPPCGGVGRPGVRVNYRLRGLFT